MQTSIQTEGFRSLAEGEPVEYYLEAGDDGRTKAVQVTGPNGAPPQVWLYPDSSVWTQALSGDNEFVIIPFHRIQSDQTNLG